MATQALIQINSVAGSNTTLPLNTLVNLSNSGAGGETTWEWTLISQPAGSAVVLSSLNTSTSSFTPTKEGSYLIQLVVNKGAGDEKTNTVIAAVRELQTYSRIPAAGETLEVSSTDGWSNAAVSEILQRVTRLTDSGVLVGKAGESLTSGDVVYISDITPIASGLPGERQVPTFRKAHANIVAETHGVMGVFSQKVTGGGGAIANDLIRVTALGPVVGVTMASGGVAGDNVYIDDTGALSLTAGTHTRQVGTVASASGTTYDVYIAGLAESGGGSAAGAAGGVLGYPGSTYPNPLGLAANMGDEIPIAPYAGSNAIVLRADDQSTMNGTTISLVGGSATAGVSGGGNVELSAGTSVGGTGGGIALYGASGPRGGDITITSGTGSVNDGGDVVISASSGSNQGGAVDILAGSGTSGGQITLAAGTSTGGAGAQLLAAGGSGTTTGGIAGIQGGASSNSAGVGGAATVTGGTGGATGTGGAVTLAGGSVSAAQGGSITLGGGVASPAVTGSVTIRTQNAAATGSAGNVSILAGNGGSSGTAGSITLLAGNSTQNSAISDGGQVAITAGNNTTANGQGGNVTITAGTGALSNAGGVITLYGGNSDVNKKSNIELIAGSNGGTGYHVKLAGGAGTGSNGHIYIGGGAGAGTAGQVFVGYSGVVNGPAASDVFIGTVGKDTTIKGTIVINSGAGGSTTMSGTSLIGTDGGNTSIGAAASVNTILGTTNIGDTSQVTTIKGTTSIGDSGTTTSRLVLTSANYTFNAGGTLTGLTIPVTTPTIRIVLNSGAVNQESVPSITTTGIASGTRITIVNASAASVTFNSDPHVAGTQLKLGANSRVLSQYGVLELQFMRDVANIGYWTEVSFRG